MKRGRGDALVLPVMAVLVLLIDQASKYFVIAWLEEGQSWDIAPWLAPFVRITYVTNTGAVFGLFPQWGGFFVVVAVIVIVAIVLYHRHLPDGQGLVRIALGLQVGGAFGNLVDRLRHGFVVDFVDLSFWPLHNWPVFNLADASVVAGVTLLVLLMMREERGRLDGQQVDEDG